MSPSKSTTYLITGGNRGVGFEFVKALASRENAFVIATTRSPSQQLTEFAEKAGNVKVLSLTVDDEQSVEEFGKALAQIENLSIDYFISNAGYSDSLGETQELPRDSWIKHWKINGLGPVDVYKAVHPFLNPTDSKLVFISTMMGSISSRENIPINAPAYGAAKLYLNYAAKNISVERKGKSIVVCLHPGVVDSDMGKAFAADAPKYLPTLDYDAVAISPAASVEAQLKIVDNLTPEQNGRFFSYDGSEMAF